MRTLPHWARSGEASGAEAAAQPLPPPPIWTNPDGVQQRASQLHAPSYKHGARHAAFTHMHITLQKEKRGSD